MVKTHSYLIRTLVFDFRDAGSTVILDSTVNEIYLFAEETVPVDGTGLILPMSGGSVAWRNKTLRFKDVGSFSVARVVATDYTGLTLKLGAEDAIAVADSAEFKLPATYGNARDWDLDIVHHGQIAQLQLISRTSYAVDKNLVVIRKQQDPFTWLDKRIMASKPIEFTCGHVLADSYDSVVLNLYVGDATSATTTITVTSGDVFRLPRIRPERLWRVDVVTTAVVHELALATSMERISRA